MLLIPPKQTKVILLTKYINEPLLHTRYGEGHFEGHPQLQVAFLHRNGYLDFPSRLLPQKIKGVWTHTKSPSMLFHSFFSFLHSTARAMFMASIPISVNEISHPRQCDDPLT